MLRISTSENVPAGDTTMRRMFDLMTWMMGAMAYPRVCCLPEEPCSTSLTYGSVELNKETVLERTSGRNTYKDSMAFIGSEGPSLSFSELNTSRPSLSRGRLIDKRSSRKRGWGSVECKN